MNNRPLFAVVLLSAALVACGDKSEKTSGETPAGDKSAGDKAPADKPAPAPAANPLPTGHILIDHILIGVKGPGRNAGFKRSEADARAFAQDLLAKLKSGADWANAKRENSDDPPPGGPYQLADHGVSSLAPLPQDTTVLQEFARSDMAPAFGDVGFKLAIGEIGLAEYDRAKSPFGFHIIKRLR